MCGIAGFLKLTNQKPSPPLKDMLALMNHRGPDESHAKEGENWGIGLNRLAITAPKEPHTQPLWSEDGRYGFVFNGEIYNYKIIRQELEKTGMTFRTSGDAEVLFKSFLARGPEALTQCQGMFSFALWDKQEKIWTLGRDPVGIKPLYYIANKDVFCFSSEIKPLLKVVPQATNTEVLKEYLQKRYVSGRATFFKNIFKVLPGHLLRVGVAGILEEFSYWKFENHQDRQISTQEFYEVLRDSLEMTVSSDSPAISLLSGGVDSSIVAQGALASGRTDALFFDNGYDFHEREAAEYFAAEKNLHLRSVKAHQRDYEVLHKAIHALEEPLADSIIVPTYRLLEAAAIHHRVVFSGEGADELLAGYVHHAVFRRLLTLEKWHLLPLLRQALVKNPLDWANRFMPYPAHLSSRELQGISQSLERRERWSSLFYLFSDPEVKTLCPDLDHGVADLPPKSLNELIQKDLENWLPNYNLLRMDKLSMIHSVELRVPFLNLNFIEACGRLADSQRTDLLGRRKKILREAAAKYMGISKKIAYRKKHPFTLKEHHVYDEGYRRIHRDAVSSSFIKEFGFNSKVVENIFKSEGFIAHKKQASLIHLGVWYDQFVGS